MRSSPEIHVAEPLADCACPACGSESSTECFRVSAADAAQHFVLKEEDLQRHGALETHVTSLWKGPVCRVVRCSRCRFRYAVPFVAGDETFYALAYRRTGYPSDKWEYSKAFEFIERLPRRRRRLLEVGAGDGRFVRIVSPALIQREDIVATEFSEYGVRELGRLGIRAMNVHLRTLSREECGGGFDLVCIFQVLEHLDDVSATFAKLREVCNDDGLIFIATPSDVRIEFNETHAALIDMPPNHLSLWNKDAFARLAERSGFRLLEHCYGPKRFAADSLLFLKYRFLRAAQGRGSWANAIWTIRNPRVRNVLAGLWMLCSLPRSARSLRELWKCPVGESQFAALARDPEARA